MRGGRLLGGSAVAWPSFHDSILPAILRLENHLSCKPKGALAGQVAGFARELRSAGCSRDNSKIRIGDIRVRVAEIWRVGHGEGVYSELETYTLGDPEAPQKTRIQIKEARPAEDVASGSAVADLAGWDGPERTRREILARWVRKGAIHESTRGVLMLDLPNYSDWPAKIHRVRASEGVGRVNV